MPKSGALPEAVLPAGTFDGKDVLIDRRNGFNGNLQALQTAAPMAGHFNPQIDPDGIFRRVPMLIEYDGKHFESLSLAIVRTLLEKPQITPGYPAESGYNPTGGFPDLQTPRVTLRIPVNEEASTLIPFRGPQKSFPTIPQQTPCTCV